MNETTSLDWLTVTVSLIFWTAPFALTIHLAVIRNKSKRAKLQVSYIYGVLWAIALSSYLWMFFR